MYMHTKHNISERVRELEQELPDVLMVSGTKTEHVHDVPSAGPSPGAFSTTPCFRRHLELLVLVLAGRITTRSGAIRRAS